MINISTGAIEITTDPNIFTVLDIGSCIGFCAYDPIAKVAGIAHFMLPETHLNDKGNRPGKFVDTGIQTLVEKLAEKGAVKTRLVVAYAGGSQLLKLNNPKISNIDIGKRNQEAVKKTIAKLDLTCIGMSVGGGSGRTLIFDTNSGDIYISTVHTKKILLCNLKENSR